MRCRTRGRDGQGDRRGEVVPQPLIATADLLLRDAVTALGHTVGDASNRTVFGDEDHVERHAVSSTYRLGDERDLGGVRELGLGDKGLVPCDESMAHLLGDRGSIVGTDSFLAGPTPCRDVLGVDERQAGQRPEDLVVEGGLARAVGPSEHVQDGVGHSAGGRRLRQRRGSGAPAYRHQQDRPSYGGHGRRTAPRG